MQLVCVPNPVLFDNPFFVEGTLSGTGASTHEIVMQTNPFPCLAGFKDVGPNYSEPILIRSGARRGALLVDGTVAGWLKGLAYCLTYAIW